MWAAATMPLFLYLIQIRLYSNLLKQLSEADELEQSTLGLSAMENHYLEISLSMCPANGRHRNNVMTPLLAGA